MAKDKSGNKGGLFPGIKWAYVGISVFLLALGVCALVWPEITAGTVCIAIGIAAILFGIVKLIAYFLREVKGIGLNYDLSIGVLGIAAGIFLLVGKDRVIDLLQIVIGIYLVVDSVFKLQTSVDAKRLGVGGWWVSLILSLACAAFGVVLALRVGSNILMILIGVALIVDGLQNLCLVIFSAMAAKALARMTRMATACPTSSTPPICRRRRRPPSRPPRPRRRRPRRKRKLRPPRRNLWNIKKRKIWKETMTHGKKKRRKDRQCRKGL